MHLKLNQLQQQTSAAHHERSSFSYLRCASLMETFLTDALSDAQQNINKQKVQEVPHDEGFLWPVTPPRDAKNISWPRPRRWIVAETNMLRQTVQNTPDCRLVQVRQREKKLFVKDELRHEPCVGGFLQPVVQRPTVWAFQTFTVLLVYLWVFLRCCLLFLPASSGLVFFIKH